MDTTPQPVKAKPTKIILVILAALLIVIAFFFIPWATDDWDPGLYGNNASEIASKAPILWIIPTGALLVGIIALIANDTNRRSWVSWLLALLIAIAMLYPHAWITNALYVRQLTMTVEVGSIGQIYIPWDSGEAMSMIYEHDVVLAGLPDPGIGYYLSLFANFVIILFSIIRFWHKPAIAVEQPIESPEA